MKLTAHQKTIVQYALDHNSEITKKEACTLIRFYHNTEKHVGDILSRMVKAGILTRIKKGHFKIGSGRRVTVSINIENQANLF